MTEEWLDFIVDCRHGKPHHYDVVIGAMANDQIYNYVADYLDGVISREAFWILSNFKYPTHQIAFCRTIESDLSDSSAASRHFSDNYIWRSVRIPRSVFLLHRRTFL